MKNPLLNSIHVFQYYRSDSEYKWCKISSLNKQAFTICLLIFSTPVMLKCQAMLMEAISRFRDQEGTRNKNRLLFLILVFKDIFFPNMSKNGFKSNQVILKSQNKPPDELY